MIGQWMLYGVALTAVVSAVALAAEYALRLYGRSTRWLWATSLLAALVLPLLAWVFTAPQAPAAVGGLGDVASATVVASPMPAASAPAPSLWSRATRLEGRLDGKLPWVCLGASLLAALGLALSYGRLRRQRGQWREAEVDGVRVLVSEGTGPAVVGLRRGRIVVPAWVLEESEARRRLILAHETEHLAAGDARLLTGALAAIVAAPWNPLVWWQIRRLRLATEVDCDARVVRRRGDLRGYAGLLLDVGMRFGEGGVLAAFAEPRSLLARRLRALTAPLPGRRGWRVALAATGGLAVAALACVAPSPDKPLPSEPIGRAQVVAADTAGPHDIPHTVAPELANREEVVRALLELYPPVLRNAGIGGRALIWAHIDRAGQVTTSRIRSTSGRAELDSAAVRLGRVMRFTPARNGSAPTDIWVGLPVVFMPKGGSEQAAGSREDSLAAVRAGVALRPPPGLRRELPPGVRAPELINAAQVKPLLGSLYPAALKEAGIGGTIWLRLHIDEHGVVGTTAVAATSGQAELDAAAEQVGRGMRFQPATDSASGKPVAVDMVIPIVFRPAPGSAKNSGPAPAAAAASPAAAARESDRAQAQAALRQDTFDVPPRVLNRDELNAAARRLAPQVQHAAAPPVVRMHVDETGQATAITIARSSGVAEADSAALAVSRLMRFSPALRQGKPVAAWFEWGRPPARPTPEQIRQGPVFTPFSVAPELINRDEVRPALVREYPPELKAAGLGGRTELWMLLDESGTPLRVSVRKSSGQAALDSAAVRVGEVMRFTAAQDQGKPVEVWIAVPVIFKTAPTGAPGPAGRDTAREAHAAAGAAGEPKTPPAKRPVSPGALVASWFVPVLGHD